MTTFVHSRLGHWTQQRAGATTGRYAVPWSTVVTFATVIAFADWFWVMSLRGAAGAIERNQAPFTDWLRESTLVLPVFVLAVLAAFAVALRRFGPTVHRAGPVISTSLLLVMATTSIAIAGLTASSAYDYYLQSNQLDMMDAMRAMCAGDCGSLRQASLRLQRDVVGYGSALLLGTNLLVVAWMVAVRGGRLNLGKASASVQVRPEGEAVAARGTRTSRLDDVRVFLVAGLLGSAVIHAAVVPEHLTEWRAAGVFFVALTGAQLAVALQVLARPRNNVALGAVVISLVPLLLWAVSRTVGIPIGPVAGVPEPIGLADTAAGVLNAATLLTAVVLLRKAGALRHRPAASAHATWLALLTVLAVTLIGLGGTNLPWLSYSHGVSVMDHH